MKAVLCVVFLLFLSACTNVFLTDDLASSGPDFEVFYKVKNGTQNFITIQAPLAENSYTIML